MFHPCWANLFHLDVDSEVVSGYAAVLGRHGGRVFLEFSPAFFPANVEVISTVANDLACQDRVVEGV